jgi:hypothetical protein
VTGRAMVKVVVMMVMIDGGGDDITFTYFFNIL